MKATASFLEDAKRPVKPRGLCRWKFVLLFLLLPLAATHAALPPVARSLEFNGEHSNVVYHGVKPWMNTNTVNLTVETWMYARDLDNLQALVARAQSTNLWLNRAASRKQIPISSNVIR